MRTRFIAGATALAIAAIAMTATSASAQRWHGHHGGWGWGGPAAGFAAGALIGGALAARPYYGPDYYAGGYAYEEPGYVVAPEAGPDAASYCAQRFRSYDPASGTYLGFDGARHPCP
jgi:hypothetical protein